MASPPIAAIDPRKQGQYTLKVGKGLKAGSSSSSFSSVKFNHKPNLSNASRLTKLSCGSDGNASLAIKDDEGGSTSKYTYKGRKSTSKNSYVLIFDPDSQSCTLEPVKSTYNFNLTSAPWEPSQEKLSRQYTQIKPNEASSTEDLDEDLDGEPDAHNPYDFRHYLNINSKASPSPSPPLRPASVVNTPSLNSTRPSTTAPSKTQSRPAAKTDPLRQAPRKQKPTPAAAETNKKPTPTVRLDRRASTRPGDAPEKKVAKPPKQTTKSTIKSDYYVHSSDDEDDLPPPEKAVDAEETGGLEIDWGNHPPKKATSQVLDLPENAHDGPISLHSAANSPAGRMTVPRQQKRRQEYEQDVIDFGASEGYDEDDEDEGQPQARKAAEDQDIQMHDVEESDGDADVEPMDIGSPAHQQPAPEVADAEGDGEDLDFDDDDFAAQMMEAMENEDDEDRPVAQEESDESEAE